MTVTGQRPGPAKDPAPAERPRLILPGLLPADPGLERYRVHPGAVTAVELDPGDVLTVIDEEGRQRGELTVLAGGGEDYPALGTEADTAATVLRAMAGPAGTGPAGTGAVAGPLAGRGLDPGQARAVALFGEWSPAGARAEFAARRHLTAVVAAPGGPMSVAAGNPPSDLVLEVRRVSPRRPEQRPLPPPLADPLLDLRVDTATARSYEVKAGQYIQVIDVEGRQCSDFLAFCARRLADGTERGLDATTTRNLTGNAYPQPGLFGKFFDQDMRPLVEVVRDTVGLARHVRASLQRQVLRGHGLPGPPELHRQLQRAACPVRHHSPARLAGPQLLLQHRLQRGEPAALRRALVPARGLRAAAGHDRPGLCLLGLPR